MTDPGLARDNNEDNFFISDTEALCIVADGMGGHRSGEVASQKAIETIESFYDESLASLSDDSSFRFRLPRWPFSRRKPQHLEEKRLVQAVMLANEIVFNHANAHAECRGMGTTIVGAFFLEAGCYLIHIGDSRAYRLREGKLELLTQDHSLANEYLQMGILRPDEIESFPYKNVITRALGLNDSVEPEVDFETIQHNDKYLLCSDGLTDPVPDQTIEEILASHHNLDSACRALIDAANAGGGPDNVTVLVAQTLED